MAALAAWCAGCGFSLPLPALISSPSTIQLPGGDVQVGFDLFAGFVIVDAKINGLGPFKLIVDTGASTTVISPEIASLLPNSPRGATQVTGAGQGEVRADFIELDALAIGDMSFKKFDATILQRIVLQEDGDVLVSDGIVGLSMFRVVLLTIDYVNHTMRVRQGSLGPSDGCDIQDVVALPDQGDLLGVPLVIDGRTATPILDTGNNGFLTLTSQFDNINFMGTPQMGTAGGVTGTFTVLRGPITGSVDIGCFNHLQPTVSVGAAVNSLGGQAFARFALTLDAANKKLGLVQLN